MELKLTLLNEIETLRDHQCYILPAAWKISSPDSYGSEASLLQAKMQTLSYRQGCDGTNALPFGLWPKERKTLCLLPTISIFLIWLLLLYFSSTQGSYFKTH